MSQDILCEAPGPGGRTCTLPYGHKPENIHAFDIALPDDVGDLIEGYMTHLEEARERYERERKRARLMFWLWGVMCVLYLGLTLMKVIA